MINKHLHTNIMLVRFGWFDFSCRCIILTKIVTILMSRNTNVRKYESFQMKKMKFMLQVVNKPQMVEQAGRSTAENCLTVILTSLAMVSQI